MSSISISEFSIIAPRSRRFSARIHGLAFCRATVLPLSFRVARAGRQAPDHICGIWMTGIMVVYLLPLDRSTIYSISSCANHPAVTFSHLNMSLVYSNVKGRGCYSSSACHPCFSTSKKVWGCPELRR